MSAIAMDISEFTPKIKELIAGLKRNEEIIITAFLSLASIWELAIRVSITRSPNGN